MPNQSPSRTRMNIHCTTSPPGNRPPLASNAPHLKPPCPVNGAKWWMGAWPLVTSLHFLVIWLGSVGNVN
ncbi:hypothetical protein L209DRAFT_759914 [Thermothelomyces heterothallicus CBS 203.75]